MSRRAHSQQGLTLPITLILLTAFTVFVVAMVRLSSTNANVVGNMQTQYALTNSAQWLIEQDLGSQNFWSDAVGGTGWWSGGVTTHTQTVDGYTVTLSEPICLLYVQSSGYSSLSAVALQDTYWEVSATALDTVTNATVKVTQGVKITLPAGNCNPTT